MHDWLLSTHSYDEVSTINPIVICEFQSKIEYRYRRVR